jgi:hypothetical protein
MTAAELDQMLIFFRAERDALEEEMAVGAVPTKPAWSVVAWIRRGYPQVLSSARAAAKC